MAIFSYCTEFNHRKLATRVSKMGSFVKSRRMARNLWRSWICGTNPRMNMLIRNNTNYVVLNLLSILKRMLLLLDMALLEQLFPSCGNLNGSVLSLMKDRRWRMTKVNSFKSCVPWRYIIALSLLAHHCKTISENCSISCSTYLWNFPDIDSSIQICLTRKIYKRNTRNWTKNVYVKSIQCLGMSLITFTD